jgi:hypothetical protein
MRSDRRQLRGRGVTDLHVRSGSRPGGEVARPAWWIRETALSIGVRWVRRGQWRASPRMSVASAPLQTGSFLEEPAASGPGQHAGPHATTALSQAPHHRLGQPIRRRGPRSPRRPRTGGRRPAFGCTASESRTAAGILTGQRCSRRGTGQLFAVAVGS